MVGWIGDLGEAPVGIRRVNPGAELSILKRGEIQLVIGVAAVSHARTSPREACHKRQKACHTGRICRHKVNLPCHR